jgi:hypothetical protein
MKKKHYILLYVLVIASVLSCDKTEKKETEPIVISATPSIALNKVSPKAIKEFDALTFTIAYTDGDGNLGDPDPDEKSLELTDNREGLVHYFHIPPLAPEGETISITGIFTVELEHIILIDQQSDTEEATFSLRIKDRSGNWSNMVQSEVITISK